MPGSLESCPETDISPLAGEQLTASRLAGEAVIAKMNLVRGAAFGNRKHLQNLRRKLQESVSPADHIG